MTRAAGRGATSPTSASEARLKALYSIMQSIENKLGGGEGVEGLYGSIKKSGMDKVLKCLRVQCGLDARSVMVDVGAGLGRPLMHALLEPGIAGARGIEIDRIKCDKAAAFLQQAVLELRRRGVAGTTELLPPPVECSAIENVRSLDPCTHAYSFWEGVPWEGKAAFGSLFAGSRTLRSVAVVQRAIRTCPLQYMEELGFGELVLVGSFSVSMSGSGRSFTAYVFNKALLPAALPVPLALEQGTVHSVLTPAQAGELAAAVDSMGAVSPAAELNGESAERGLAAAAVAVEATAFGRGCRQRRPSTKQQEAEEPQQEQRQVSAREQRADRRNAAASEAAKASAQQEAQAAAVKQHQPQQQVGVEQAGESPSRTTCFRSIASPAAAATVVQLASKLTSPQNDGVQKRASPVKGTSRSPPNAEHGAAASRKLTCASMATGKGGEETVAKFHTPGSAGLLQRAARITKSGVVEGVPKLRPARVAATTRRGLQT